MHKLIGILLLFFHSSFAANGQLHLWSSIGIQVPGQQDLKIKEFGNENTVINQTDLIQTSNTTTAITSAGLTYYQRNNGIRIEFTTWEHSSMAFETFQSDHPILTEQDRSSILVSFLRRWEMLQFNQSKTRIETYAGLGYGYVLTEVERGTTRSLRTGFQFLAGCQITLSKHIYAMLEYKYILSRDADNVIGKKGQYLIDTSGSFTPFRFGAHFDTRHHAFLIGINLRLY